MMSIIRKFFVSQLGLWFLIAAVGVYFMATVKDRLNFGIDLVGGTYITLQVDTGHVIEQELQVHLKHLQDLARTKNMDVSSAQVDPAAASLTVVCADAAQASILTTAFRDTYKIPSERVSLQAQAGTITLSLTPAYRDELAAHAVSRNVDVLRARLDKMSVSEISVVAVGDNRIVIELPNVHDPETAKQVIGKAAVLEIKKVHKVGNRPEDLYSGQLPADKMIVSGSENRRGMPAQYYLVSKIPDLTGDSLRTAVAELDREQYAPAIVFTLNAQGSTRFYELTKQNIGQMLAIVLDGNVLTAPKVNSAISDSGRITGFGSMEEANMIASLLKTGAFAAPVSYLEERHIGPSLGQESVYQGVLSCLLGFLLLFVFVVFLYKIPGLFALIALVFNLLITLFTLSFLHATLTLPGIAGLILSIGMAIDASILIYERIKEELARGAVLKAAIQSGFAGAMSVILDANITHFIVSLVLYFVGSGPVQGFAVTMLVGIVATLLTGVVFLRALFDFCTYTLGVQKMRF